MNENRLNGVQRVQKALQDLGFALQVEELPQTTRTSAEAASAVGCQVGQIAKSLVFRGKHTGRPVLVIASGANRVNENLLAELVGEPVEKPDAGYVRDRTGFVIGGVAPVGLAEPLDVFVDRELLRYPEIWAAAGNPNAVFRLTGADLLKITGGKLVSVK